jgi:hypothetical protein
MQKEEVLYYGIQCAWYSSRNAACSVMLVRSVMPPRSVMPACSVTLVRSVMPPRSGMPACSVMLVR